MTTQLSLYNGALLLAGERFLASLTEEREPRRLLDQVWNNGAGPRACLEMGQWNFAMRASQIDYDSSIEPAWGYSRAFDKPTDWVLTSGLCTDEFLRVPLLRYLDEGNYWYTDLDTIYVRYVSNDVMYGMDLSKWPESFREMVEEFLCSRIILKLTNSEEREKASLERLEKKKKHALSRAAMAAATSYPARGAWANSRMRFPYRHDGGNTSGNLIG